MAQFSGPSFMSRVLKFAPLKKGEKEEENINVTGLFLKNKIKKCLL